MFTVSLLDENNFEVALPDRVLLTPEWFDAQEIGGYKDCDIKVTGPDSSYWTLKEWVGYKITVYNNCYDVVWTGLIESVLLNISSGQVGWSLKDVRNRIAIAYTTEKAGESIRGTTAWAEDTESIRRYGRRDHIESHSDMDETTALALRDKLLLDLSQVYGTLTLGRSSVIGATIRCVGIYTTLESIHYTNLSGLEEYQGDQVKQIPLGQGFTSTNIGFTGDGYIHDLAGQLHNLQKNSRVKITGSTSNNFSYLVADDTNTELKSYSSATIGFTANNKIYEDAANLGFVGENDYIQITGAVSSFNNGIKRITNSGSKVLELDPLVNVTAGTGPTVYVTRGNKIGTSENPVVQEFPGSSITLVTHGQAIGQTFSLAVNTSFTLSQISLSLRKIGNPTDSVIVQIRTTNLSLPNAIIQSVSIPATDIGKDISTIIAVFPNTAVLTYGTLYAVVLTRTGANDINDYYEVEVSEASSYPRGYLYLYDGVSWNAPYTASELNFSVTGAQETTGQLTALVTAVISQSVNAYIKGIDIIALSGRYSPQFQNGDRKAQDVVSDLLSLGSVNSPFDRMILLTTKEKLLRFIPVLADVPGQNLQWTAQKTIIDGSGKLIPKGFLPVGEWIEVEELPESVVSSTGLSPFFCGYARYDCVTGEYEIRPSEQRDVFV